MSYSAQTDRFVHDRLPPPEQWPRLTYTLPELQLPGQVNLVQALFESAAKRGLGDLPLLRSPRRTLSYAQAQAEVARIAQVLVQDYGLVPGNRVLLRGGNSIGMALAWLAVVQAGAVAVATMPLLRAKELGDIIDKAQPTLAICDERLLDELQIALAQQPVLQTLVSFDALHQSGELALAAARCDGQRPPCATAADDIALLAFTSGTTGKPKAAVHTHRDVLAACETWPRHVLRATPDDIVMGPQALAQLIFDTGATIVYTAPTFYRQMAPFMQEQAAQRGRAAALRLSVSAGEGLPDATRQLWKNATGLEMLDGIGATEMFHIFISAAPEDVRRGAIGTVVPGYTARVVGEDGQELPRGSVGRIAVMGPTGCKYMGDARQASYVKDGWNYPGDAFVQDAEGYFFYQARTDDMIITSGYNVGAPEVEDALLSHPAVAECGVIGQSDEARGMIVKAFCVLRPGVVGDAALVQALQDHVKATIAPYKYPREITFLDKLPRTETGKLQRFRLKTP